MAGRFSTFGLAGTPDTEERNYLVDASAVLPDLLAEGWAGGPALGHASCPSRDGPTPMTPTGRSTSGRSRSTARRHDAAAGGAAGPSAPGSVRARPRRLAWRRRAAWAALRPALAAGRRRGMRAGPHATTRLQGCRRTGGRRPVEPGLGRTWLLMVIAMMWPLAVPTVGAVSRSSFRGWRTRLRGRLPRDRDGPVAGRRPRRRTARAGCSAVTAGSVAWQLAFVGLALVAFRFGAAQHAFWRPCLRLPPLAPGGRRGLVTAARAGLLTWRRCALLCGPVMLAMTVGHSPVLMVCASLAAWWEAWHPRAWRDPRARAARRRGGLLAAGRLALLGAGSRPWLTSSPRSTSSSRTDRSPSPTGVPGGAADKETKELTLPGDVNDRFLDGPACRADRDRRLRPRDRRALPPPATFTPSKSNPRRGTVRRRRRRDLRGDPRDQRLRDGLPDGAHVRGAGRVWAGRSSGRSGASSCWSCRGRGSGPTPSTSGRPGACSSSPSPARRAHGSTPR